MKHYLPYFRFKLSIAYFIDSITMLLFGKHGRSCDILMDDILFGIQIRKNIKDIK